MLFFNVASISAVFFISCLKKRCLLTYLRLQKKRSMRFLRAKTFLWHRSMHWALPLFTEKTVRFSGYS